jgi:hypothetical protein
MKVQISNKVELNTNNKSNLPQQIILFLGKSERGKHVHSEMRAAQLSSIFSIPLCLCYDIYKWLQNIQSKTAKLFIVNIN